MNPMRSTQAMFAAAVIFWLSPLTTSANPFHAIGHYVNTHKQLLAADVIYTTATFLDAYSSGQCDGCRETNPLLPAHPSPGQFYTASSIGSIVGIGFNHAIWHFAPSEHARRAIWVPTGIRGGVESWNIPHNFSQSSPRPSDKQSRPLPAFTLLNPQTPSPK